MPQRIQRKRIKGWRMPLNTIYVGRPTKWGNPFDYRDIENCYTEREKREYAVEDFETWLIYGFTSRPELEERRQYILSHLHNLRGENLACWCSLSLPCHVDVLLRLANGDDFYANDTSKNKSL